MTENALFVLTLIAALGAGLVAGVFFAFSTFVMPALSRVSPASGIAAMQSVNIAAINPWFMSALFGTGAACLILIAASVWTWPGPGATFALAGSLLYLAGSIGVTLACNVPLNNALASVDQASESGAGIWAGYLVSWTAWNHVRTIASLAAAACFTIALCWRSA